MCFVGAGWRKNHEGKWILADPEKVGAVGGLLRDLLPPLPLELDRDQWHAHAIFEGQRERQETQVEDRSLLERLANVGLKTVEPKPDLNIAVGTMASRSAWALNSCGRRFPNRFRNTDLFAPQRASTHVYFISLKFICPSQGFASLLK